MTAYLLVFVTAAVVTFLVTPLVRRFVIRVGVIYQPNDRSVHPVPLPTMGGIAMYVGFVVALAVVAVPAVLRRRSTDQPSHSPRRSSRARSCSASA